MTPLFWVEVFAEDRSLFKAPEVETWEGGMPDLIRQQRSAWQREGSGSHMPVDDHPTYRRIKHYANDYGSGTWQTHIKRWARQLPDDVPDPQGSLF